MQLREVRFRTNATWFQNDFRMIQLLLGPSRSKPEMHHTYWLYLTISDYSGLRSDLSPLLWSRLCIYSPTRWAIPVWWQSWSPFGGNNLRWFKNFNMESMESSAGMSGMWCGYAGDFRYVVRICRWLPVHGVEQVMHPLGRWLVLWKLPSTQLQGSLLLLIGCIKIHLNSFDSFSTIEHPAFPVHVAVSIHMIRQRSAERVYSWESAGSISRQTEDQAHWADLTPRLALQASESNHMSWYCQGMDWAELLGSSTLEQLLKWWAALQATFVTALTLEFRSFGTWTTFQWFVSIDIPFHPTAYFNQVESKIIKL